MLRVAVAIIHFSYSSRLIFRKLRVHYAAAEPADDEDDRRCLGFFFFSYGASFVINVFLVSGIGVAKSSFVPHIGSSWLGGTFVSLLFFLECLLFFFVIVLGVLV
jgi:hypothetical protein